MKVRLSEDAKSLTWKAHSANTEETIDISKITSVTTAVLRQGREKLGFSISYDGGSKKLMIEAVSERARKQWIDGLSDII